jgi:hypothetical protein
VGTTFVRENGLSLFFFVIFVAAVFGQSLAGLHAHNDEVRQHGGEAITWAGYVTSSEFGAGVLENWQSEYLQFALFIAATIWLIQRGSNESKRESDAGLESKKAQRVEYAADSSSPLSARVGGWRTAIYSNSLLIVMGLIFLASWAGQSLTGWREFNDVQAEHGDPQLSWAAYIGRGAFWERTLQNWQSEFLAVGTMVIFTVFLRQRGSPESKPVGAPHGETASSG